MGRVNNWCLSGLWSWDPDDRHGQWEQLLIFHWLWEKIPGSWLRCRRCRQEFYSKVDVPNGRCPNCQRWDERWEEELDGERPVWWWGRVGNRTKDDTRLEIAEKLGISAQRVAQIEEKALRKLRHACRGWVVRCFVETVTPPWEDEVVRRLPENDRASDWEMTPTMGLYVMGQTNNKRWTHG